MTRLPRIWWLSERWATGYGEAGRRAVRALADAGVPVRWLPLGARDGGPVRELVDAPTVWADLEPLRHTEVRPDVVVAHCIPEALPHLATLVPGVPLISHIAWETTSLPKKWPALLAGAAGVWVPCEWNVGIVEATVDRPVAAIPHVLRPVAADPARREAMRRRLGVRPDDVCVLNIGMWLVRKAPWLTARVVADTFSKDDPVVAVLKTSGRLYGGTPGADEPDPRMRVPAVSLARQLAGKRNVARVVLVAQDDLPEEEMDDFLRAADVYLTLSHGEAAGLGALDAAASGVPVIATGWGGLRDHLEGVSMLVGAAEVPVVSDHDSYDPSQRWADADLGDAARLLRGVVADPAAARAAAERTAPVLRERHSPAAVAERIVDEVRRVLHAAGQ